MTWIVEHIFYISLKKMENAFTFIKKINEARHKK